MSSAIPFKQIAVIGAGTMGSGIAGQIANAGHNVLLLDLPADDQANAVTEGAVQRLLKSDPPALMHKSRAELITCGNIPHRNAVHQPVIFSRQIAIADGHIHVIVDGKMCYPCFGGTVKER